MISYSSFNLKNIPNDIQYKRYKSFGVEIKKHNKHQHFCLTFHKNLQPTCLTFHKNLQPTFYLLRNQKVTKLVVDQFKKDGIHNSWIFIQFLKEKKYLNLNLLVLSCTSESLNKLYNTHSVPLQANRLSQDDTVQTWNVFFFFYLTKPFLQVKQKSTHKKTHTKSNPHKVKNITVWSSLIT